MSRVRLLKPFWPLLLVYAVLMLGYGLIVMGVALIFLPAGVIAAGALLIAGVLLPDLAPPSRITARRPPGQ